MVGSSRTQSVPSRFEEKGTQAEWINIRPEIRSGRNSFPHVKDTIASVSTRAGISVAKARIATLKISMDISAESTTQATAKELWEEVTAFMSDAVTKNLHVPELVAAELKSDHIPSHLLCNAHTGEKLDENNVKNFDGH